MDLVGVFVLLVVAAYIAGRAIREGEGGQEPSPSPGNASCSGAVAGGNEELFAVTAPAPSAPISHCGRALVQPVDRPYWQINHWKPDGDQLRGFYRTPYASIEGYVTQWRAGRPRFHIIDPPEALEDHSHAVCFHPKGKGHYWIHFKKTPRTVDDGILSIEKILGEALTPQQGR